MHDLSLISTIAAGFAAAWVLGLITQRFGLSPIVGYLLAGVVIGPHTPGFIGDVHIAQQLAEVGVILLMFGVGLHFHVKDLMAVKNVAVPGAVGQSLAATLIAMLVFELFDIPIKTGAVIGMAMAVASTVVLIRVLMDADVLNSSQGHVAVGWLIVEDIFTVILLVLIPVLGAGAVVATGDAHAAEAGPLWMTLGIALLKLAGLVAVLMVVGVRVVPWALVQVARLRSRELFTLTVLVFSIAIAAGSYFMFGASMALGAFLAGMVVAQSPVSHQAAADALPLRDAFAVLFFVSVGMLFDPGFLLEKPLMIAAGLGIIFLVKPVSALVIVAILGHPVRTALTVALALAQIGEFSFILSQLAREHGLMPEEGHNLLVACAIISITCNPLIFRTLPKIESWLRTKPVLWKALNARAMRRADKLNESAAETISTAPKSSPLAILVGYGPVGRTVHRILQDARQKTVVIDMNLDTVSKLNQDGTPAIFGDASNESILEQAGMARASHLIVTLPSTSDRAAVVAAARNLNPSARILVRARYLGEREDLERAGASAAVFEEAEAAVALARLVLSDTGVHREAAESKVRDLRMHLIMENISNIRTQRARSIMIPWTRVRRLLTTASREEVLAQVSQERFSRWPVVDPSTGRAVGYLLTKDLVSHGSDAEWTRLLRPLNVIGPDDTIESAMVRMQGEGATIYAVVDGDAPVGIITLEDILEQVVGRIEDEYPHAVAVSLRDAVAAGSIVLDLAADGRDEAIRELAYRIPADRLPHAIDHAEVARLAIEREETISTDLGVGVAIPHARCTGLASPIVVLGRSHEGIVFSPKSPEPVTLIFLLVTPLEQPEVQLTLLGQLARLAADASMREKLRAAEWPAQVLELVAARQTT